MTNCLHLYKRTQTKRGKKSAVYSIFFHSFARKPIYVIIDYVDCYEKLDNYV